MRLGLDTDGGGGMAREYTFGKRTYLIREDALDGYCDLPGEPPEIWVDPRLRGRAALEAWVHEALHCIHPRWSEGRVDRAAKALSGFLWLIGYRRRK